MLARIALRILARVTARLARAVGRWPIVSAVALAGFLVPAAISWYVGTSTPVAPSAPADDTVEVSVQQVTRNPSTNRMALILKENAGPRLLILTIGDAEANAIAQQLSGQAPPRPLTADLVVSVIGHLGAQVKSVTIGGSASTFYSAQLALETAKGPVVLDCRPSDGVAVALRAGAPIYVARSIIDTSGLTPEDLLK